MSDKTGEWYASEPGWPYQVGPYGCRDLALKGAETDLDLGEGEPFEIGRLERWQPRFAVAPLIAQMRTDADMQGTVWLATTTLEQRTELGQRIEAVICQWLEEVGQPLVIVSDIETHTMPVACRHEYETLSRGGPLDPKEFVGVCKHCGHEYGDDDE